MEPIEAVLAGAKLLLAGANTVTNNANSDRALNMQWEAQQEAKKFALEQQAHMEEFNSLAHKKKELEDLGLNPYAFLDGNRSNTSMVSVDFSPPVPAPRDNTLIEALSEIIPLFRKTEQDVPKVSESQNEALALRREMLELRKDMFAQTTALNAERLEQLKADNKLTLARIETAKQLDKMADKIKSGDMPTLEEFKNAVLQFGKQKALEKTN